MARLTRQSARHSRYPGYLRRQRNARRAAASFRRFGSSIFLESTSLACSDVIATRGWLAAGKSPHAPDDATIVRKFYGHTSPRRSSIAEAGSKDGAEVTAPTRPDPQAHAVRSRHPGPGAWRSADCLGRKPRRHLVRFASISSL